MAAPLIVLTGATGGIGRAAAVALGQRGARLVLTGRDAEKGQALLAELAAIGRTDATFIALDLTRLDDVSSAAARLRARFGTIDALILNAGALFSRRRDTADGIEASLQVNHLSHFLLASLLLEPLLAAPQGRILMVTSEAHRLARLDRNDPQVRHGYSGLRAYAAAKLCTLLFAAELARRLAGTPVTVNAMHPGVVATGLWREATPLARLAVRLAGPLLTSPGTAGAALAALATEPRYGAVTGRYFIRTAQAAPAAPARDPELAGWLWRISQTLTGADFAQLTRAMAKPS